MMNNSMHPTLAIRLCALACLAALLVAATGCASRSNPWIAPNQEEFLVEKVKTTRNAYLRYAQAEEDARKDGNAEAATHYGQAKEAARLEFERYDRELSQYESQRGLKTSKGAP
jgi:hypothetical protein